MRWPEVWDGKNPCWRCGKYFTAQSPDDHHCAKCRAELAKFDVDALFPTTDETNAPAKKGGV